MSGKPYVPFLLGFVLTFGSSPFFDEVFRTSGFIAASNIFSQNLHPSRHGEHRLMGKMFEDFTNHQYDRKTFRKNLQE